MELSERQYLDSRLYGFSVIEKRFEFMTKLVVPHQALELVEQFEGFVDHIYLDSVGVPTIGFGTTKADVNPLPAHITRQQAEVFLARQLANKYLPPIEALGQNFNSNQVAALLSFDYNLGPGIFQGTRIGQLLHSGAMRQAAESLLLYDMAGGHVLQGLVTRRHEEYNLFLKPPPPPADPLHYHRFVGISFKDSHGHRVYERDTVIAYDHYRANAHKHEHELAILRKDLTFLWQHCYANARHGLKPNQHANWNFCYRGYRVRQMMKRAHGDRVGVDFKP